MNFCRWLGAGITVNQKREKFNGATGTAFLFHEYCTTYCKVLIKAGSGKRMLTEEGAREAETVNGFFEFG